MTDLGPERRRLSDRPPPHGIDPDRTGRDVRFGNGRCLGVCAWGPVHWASDLHASLLQHPQTTAGLIRDGPHPPPARAGAQGPGPELGGFTVLPRHIEMRDLEHRPKGCFPAETTADAPQVCGSHAQAVRWVRKGTARRLQGSRLGIFADSDLHHVLCLARGFTSSGTSISPTPSQNAPHRPKPPTRRATRLATRPRSVRRSRGRIKHANMFKPPQPGPLHCVLFFRY